MIVYQNSLITLTYTPETDILSAEWPNMELYSGLEVKQTVQKLIEIINNYDVKNLLLDASNANSMMIDNEFRAMLNELAEELAKTNIQKLARVTTLDPVREEKIYTMRQELFFPYQFHDFKTKDEAIKWLAG